MNEPDEQRAQELAAILQAAEAAQEYPLAPTILDPEDVDLAVQLVQLASTIGVDHDFAAALEADLRTQRGAKAQTPTRAHRTRRSAFGSATSRAPYRQHARIQPPDSAPIHSAKHDSVFSHWKWRAALAALLLLSLIVIVPTTRAALEDFVSLGSVRIYTHQPTTSRATTPTPLSSVLDLAGETSLAQARRDLPFPIRLPTYPADLGPPQHVYVQNLLGPAVVLVWMNKQHPSQVDLTLQELGSDAIVWKTPPQIIQQTSVEGHLALWVSGRYNLQYRVGEQVEYQMRSLVNGHTLIWTEASITFRLETRLTLPETIQIAASLP
ncbi:MAG TPA: hypothetical protein VGP82_10405 [Ktedonobacterales bacterium]|jgi:hypothetical protein|nr:hypothetical protein [Ktedonobacterales bacterium]